MKFQPRSDRERGYKKHFTVENELFHVIISIEIKSLCRFIAQHKSPQQGPKMLRAFIVGLLPFDYSLMVPVVKPPAEPNYDECVNERD